MNGRSGLVAKAGRDAVAVNGINPRAKRVVASPRIGVRHPRALGLGERQEREAEPLKQPLELLGRGEEGPLETGRLAAGDDLAEEGADEVRRSARERRYLEDLVA